MLVLMMRHEEASTHCSSHSTRHLDTHRFCLLSVDESCLSVYRLRNLQGAELRGERKLIKYSTCCYYIISYLFKDLHQYYIVRLAADTYFTFSYLLFKLIQHAGFSHSRPVVAPVNGGGFLWQRGEPVKTETPQFKNYWL